MSVEHYKRIKRAGDHRRVCGPGETPADIAELFGDELDRLSRGDGYDDRT